MDPAIVWGLALLAGGYLPTAPGPSLVGACFTLWLIRRRVGGTAAVLALIVGGCAAYRAHGRVATFVRERAAVREALGPPSRCAARAVVVSSPVAMRDGSRDGALVPAWEAELSGVDCEGRALERSLRARLHGGPDDLRRGDVVDVIADLAPVQLFRNVDLPDPRPGATRRGITASGGAHDVRVLERGRGVAAWVDRLRARVRARIVVTFVPDAEPMARALVLGETDLDPADAEAFRVSGLAHLLAVSGTHLVLVVAGGVAALTAVLRRIACFSARYEVGRFAAGSGVVLAWLYADFAGGSGSANRAAAMLSCVLGARAWGRASDGARGFGLSLMGAAAWDPLVGFDWSFLLSVAATAGLMLFQRPIAAFLRQLVSRATTIVGGASDAVVGAAATTLAATAGAAPLLALLSPTLPVGGIPANLLAVPLGELAALPLCLAHAALSWMPSVERGAAVVASGTLVMVRAIARVTSQSSWLLLPIPRPSPWQCAALCSCFAAWWAARAAARGRTALMGAMCLIATELVTSRSGRPVGRLRVTVLDVGQGDALLIDLPDGQAMLLDGGGMVGSPIDTGRAVIAPLLRARRRAELAAVVLSHPHPDHFGGLLTATAGLDVAAFWDNGQGERDGAGVSYAALLAAMRARQVPVLRPAALCGTHELGGARVEVLAPCPDIISGGPANDNSIVLRITYGSRSALLVGDAESAEEQLLLRDHGGDLRADFLKVGHHGSRTSSSPAWLAAVRPLDAAISCGPRNRFGHPHARALGALTGVARVHRTDQVGSITWVTDGERAEVTTTADDDW